MNGVLSEWEDFLRWLDSLGMFHMELELDRIKSALTLCGLNRPNFPIIQVVGTNGKGSTSSFIASLCNSANLKTGLYTSPHFLSPRERILVNGLQISQEKWLKAVNSLLGALNNQIKLTYFEFLTLLAIKLFSAENVDIAIFEAGLGGRYDATSALPSMICCFTPIDLDHTAILGNDLAKIASDKADALHGQKIAITAPQDKKVLKILSEKCAALDLPLLIAPPLPPALSNSPSLAGEWQKENAALALAAWRNIAVLLKIESNNWLEKKGLSNAFIAGRLQIIPATSMHPKFVLDGAHNPHGLRALGIQLRNSPPGCIIFSALKDKDWKTGLEYLGNYIKNVPLIIPQLDNSRAEKVEKITEWCAGDWPGQAIAISEPDSLQSSLNKAVQFLQDSRQYILICGSLFLLAEFYKLFPQYLRRQ